MNLNRILGWMLSISMILIVILVSYGFYLLYFNEENYEDEFKNNKKIVVKTLYTIDNNEKEKLIETALENGYELKSKGNFEYIFEKTIK
jgi:hypothetical protein